ERFHSRETFFAQHSPALIIAALVPCDILRGRLKRRVRRGEGEIGKEGRRFWPAIKLLDEFRREIVGGVKLLWNTDFPAIFGIGGAQVRIAVRTKAASEVVIAALEDRKGGGEAPRGRILLGGEPQMPFAAHYRM